MGGIFFSKDANPVHAGNPFHQMSYDCAECGMQLVPVHIEVVRNMMKHAGYQGIGIYP
jgi:hypothetical protein